MEWLLPRLIGVVASVGLAGLLGGLLGRAFEWPQAGTWAGAVCGAVGYALFDGLRGQRFLHWLRGAHANAAPRDTGSWGEVGYRVERMLRSLELQIREENSRLDQFLSAIEASPNGVLMLDSGDHIVWCNSVAADHFGLHPQRDRQQRITNLVRSPAFVAYMQSQDYREPVAFTGPGSRGTVSVLVRTYGHAMKLVLSQDTTVRERSDAMRRDFVANVSHEIRTPLTVLAGFVETMVHLPLSEAERRRVLMLMGQQTQRMQLLVGDLLTLAQLEGSARPAADRWVEVSHLFAEVEAAARALSAGRHTLSFASPADAPRIAGAQAELHSALANLVSNAIRYTPDGGRIDVAWRMRLGGAGEIEVRDTGIGIAREHLGRLTERFYRVDGSRSRDTGGTGLGLSIVKHIVQRHGGELEIHSESGQGSRFTLVLPAARVSVTSSATGEQPVKLPLSAERVAV